jgi:ser/thr/tyr protein kinase RAD53
MAPEILNGEKYSSKVDVWSLGAAFYEMVTGVPPFTGSDKDSLKRNIDKGKYKIPKHIKLSKEGKNFLSCCLQNDPEDRMDWGELLKHPYLKIDEESSQCDSDSSSSEDDIDTIKQKSRRSKAAVSENSLMAQIAVKGSIGGLIGYAGGSFAK